MAGRTKYPSETKEYQRAWRAANKEKVRANRRAHYLKHRKRILARWRRYRRANKEKIAATSRAYRKKNRKRLIAYSRAYNAAKREAKASKPKLRKGKAPTEKPGGLRGVRR